jgi:hypothetical protein
MKPEDEDEKIVGWARQLSRAVNEDNDVFTALVEKGHEITAPGTACYDAKLREVQSMAAAAGSKYSAVFQSPHLCSFLQLLLRFAKYYRPTKFFKMAGLNMFLGIHGGVSDVCRRNHRHQYIY